ncbi:hypothetical protein M422DRAFT_273115 [Sphaerobolus stellatus SS14]|uniref:Uncharacterized protein n=1 Tax=Sphaerobolus stellatus (strain SS14) TaxID=990650 RepID=A0A0C9TVQ2_SPHS4|nr:hypothetical protein M422DRAFT_273115 [Sphaerobolus stellatus SS14]
MTSKSKNTSKPIEAVKTPAFRFSNSPPPATSLSDRKACYTSKHGTVVEPLITDHKSRTPQPQPIMSTTTTISSGFRKPQWKPLQLQMMRTATAAQNLNHNPQGIQHHLGMIGIPIGHHDNHPNCLQDHLLRVEEEEEEIQTLTTLTTAPIGTGNVAARGSTITI